MHPEGPPAVRCIRRLQEFPPFVLRALLAPRSIASPDAVTLPETVDWAAVSAEANAHVVGTLVYLRLAGLDAQQQLPSAVQRHWEADLRHARLQAELQGSDAVEVSAALSSAGVRHAFIKGQAYRVSLYDDGGGRVGGDVDLLIDRANVMRTRAAMRELGYEQASCSPDYQEFVPATAEEIEAMEARHHELVQFVLDRLFSGPAGSLMAADFRRRVPFAFERVPDGVLFHSCFDIHWALDSALADADPLNDVCDAQLPLLRPEWNLLYSAFKVYFESFDRPGFGLHHLVDIHGLLQQHMASLDWSVVAELVAAHDLHGCLAQTLRAIERIFGAGLVPEECVQWLAARASRTPAPDLLQSVFGSEEMRASR